MSMIANESRTNLQHLQLRRLPKGFVMCVCGRETMRENRRANVGWSERGEECARTLERKSETEKKREVERAREK